MFKGNVATAGISFGMSEFSLHFLVPIMSNARDVAVCFALATVYLQKRDERRGVSCLVRGNDSDEGDSGASVTVKTSGGGKRDDQDGIY